MSGKKQRKHKVVDGQKVYRMLVRQLSSLFLDSFIFGTVHTARPCVRVYSHQILIILKPTRGRRPENEQPLVSNLKKLAPPPHPILTHPLFISPGRSLSLSLRMSRWRGAGAKTKPVSPPSSLSARLPITPAFQFLSLSFEQLGEGERSQGLAYVTAFV